MGKKRKEIIVAGALGNCVHVAGIAGFLRIAEELGYETHFLGAAVPVSRFIEAVDQYQPTILGISYRLTPAVAESLLRGLKEAMGEERLKQMCLVFGGTPPVCRIAENSGLFHRCFNGFENPAEVRQFLGVNNFPAEADQRHWGLLRRIDASSPFPLLRHHFGLPCLDDTIRGIREISESGVLDVISLAPDQNAQESFFRQAEMDPGLDGAGGAPIRTKQDLLRLREASKTGNYPLLRIYSGTRDLLLWARLANETIQNAWGAIPLCWYSALDGRSDRLPEEAITENRAAMRWYGESGIPLEVNEAHHWSLREAHDTVAVAAAYLAAYNARAAGVSHYIAQYMFNSPPTVSPSMDLAKMLAKIELIESLHNKNFTTYRQARAGLLHLSPSPSIAKGQLAASTMLSLQIQPHIIHVVGYCEGDHAAVPEDVIESCQIVQGVIKNCLFGLPDHAADREVQRRKQELIGETRLLLSAIATLGDRREDSSGSNDPATPGMDPLTDPVVLTKAIRMGLLDAPHLKGNPHAAGILETRTVKGAVYAWDRYHNRIIPEEQRILRILSSGSREPLESGSGSVSLTDPGCLQQQRQ